MKNGFPFRNRLHAAHYGMLYYVKRGRRAKFRVLRDPSPTCRHCDGLLRDYGGYIDKYKKNGDNVPLIRLADVWDDINPNIHRKNRPKSINELPAVIPDRVIRMVTNKDDIVMDYLSVAEAACVWLNTMGDIGLGLKLAQLHTRDGES